MTVEPANFSPNGYSNKTELPFHRNSPDLDAVKQICKPLLDTIERNKAGILQDLDPEFLHDFRVAVRRTRSLLSQLKTVFPAHRVKKFKKQFSDLGKVTNELRDLDVFLSNQKTYVDALPDYLQPGLYPVFETFAKKRKHELQKVKRKLQSQSCQNLLKAWRNFLETDDPAEQDVHDQQQTIWETASASISEQFVICQKRAEKTLKKTSDSRLHKLRIACKKLRYLLEFFKSLYPEKETASLIAQLKKIQDHLGAFNDLRVQQTKLRALMENEFGGHPQDVYICTAIGGLLTSLHQQQKRISSSSKEVLQKFLSAEIENLQINFPGKIKS